MKKFKFKKIKYFKPIIYIIIFLSAVIYYTVNSYVVMTDQQTNFSKIPESTLPRIYIEEQGEKVNQLRAYKGDYVEGIHSETLTIIPEDRRLIVDVYDLNLEINGISYEIRDKYTDALFERTQVDNITDKGEYQQIVLRIQNLILRDQEYTMKIKIDVGEEPLYYYTTVMWLTSNKFYEVFSLAQEFVTKSFNKDTGRILINYMENNANADPNQLNEVTIASSYDQLTWGSSYISTLSNATSNQWTFERENLNMTLASEVEWSVLDAKNYCYVINAEYITKSPLNKQNKYQYYFNTNEYVFRVMDGKILVMKYNRKTEEFFDKDNYILDNKKLYLGITNKKDITTVESENKNFLAFVKQKEIFIYDVKSQNLVRAFSFRQDLDKNINFKNIYNKYNIKILRLTNDGKMKFMVYGYQNSGKNEGRMGVLVSEYDSQSNKITEEIFIPTYSFYEDLRFDIEKLSYINNDNILTILIDQVVYAIDIDNKDMVVVIDNITNDTLKVSDNQKKVSWEQIVDGRPTSIVIRDNDTNYTQTKTVEKNQFISNCGFLDDTACYGIGNIGDTWYSSGRNIKDMVHTICFFDTLTGLEKKYIDEGFYFQFFTTLVNRIKFKKFIRNNQTEKGYDFQFVKDDLIINTQHEEVVKDDLIKSEINRLKKRIYYITLNNIEKNKIKIKHDPSLSVRIVELTSLKNTQKPNYFYSYDNQRIINKRLFMFEAVEDAKPNFGFIKYKGRTIWSRANKPAYVFLNVPIGKDADYQDNIQELQSRIVESNDFIIIDTVLMDANSLEYYIAQHVPVTVYLNNNKKFVITSFNGKNYRTYYMQEDRRVEYTYFELEKLLEENGYNTICALRKSRY